MKNFKIIDNTYSPLQAKEVLLTLFGDKIRFLHIQALRMREMYSGDTSAIEQRIEELKVAQSEFVKLLDEAAAQNMDIKINGEIELELIPQNVEVEK